MSKAVSTNFGGYCMYHTVLVGVLDRYVRRGGDVRKLARRLEFKIQFKHYSNNIMSSMSISVVVVDEPHFSLSLSEHHTTVLDIRALENLPFMSHPTKGASSSLIFQSTSWEEMMKAR
jgi:hypothetical protein